MIAVGAVAVVAIGWLAVSFLAPTPQRRKIEWIAATALYVALLAFFINLVRRSLASDNEAGVIAFGFLTGMFAIGLVIASVKTIAALRGSGAGKQSSATH
jgi:hypothetical protein